MRPALTAACLLLLSVPAVAFERDDAIAAYAGAFRGVCDWDHGAATPPQFTPEIYDFLYTVSWEPDAPPKHLRLYQFFCTQGAYNTGNVYLTATDEDGVRIVSFARPAFDIEYEEVAMGRAEDEVVKSLTIAGMGAVSILVNSEVDVAAGTITDHSYWRGMGDASSTGIWKLIDGQFALIAFDVDASYDGAIDYVRAFEAGTTLSGP